MKIQRKIKILISTIFVLLAILLVFFLTSGGNEITTPTGKIRNIQSPYEVGEFEMEIDLKGNSISTSKKQQILRVKKYNTEALLSFVNKFDSVSEVDFSQSFFHQAQGNVFYYSPLEAIFTVTSQEGLGGDFIINSQEELEIFLKENFEIDKTDNINRTNIEDGFEYTGNFIFNGERIGSTTLNGSALFLKTNGQGNILYLKVLLLKKGDIEVYQSMPLFELEELISIRKYPKSISILEAEERYNPTLNLYNLSELSVSKVELLYLFNESENGYILPTYKLQGEGRLISNEGDKVWAKAEVYICAIDPSYLTEKPQATKEEYRDLPSPYIPVK